MSTRLACAFIALVSVLSLCTGVTIGIVVPFLIETPRWLGIVEVTWNSASAVTDIAITISLTALFRHAKAGSSFGETRDLLSRLTRIVLQTGLLTSFLALLVLPLIFNNVVGIFALPWYILGESYVISLLANLNARGRANASVINGGGVNQAPFTTKISTIEFSPANRRSSEGEDSIDMTASLPIHSVVHTYIQHRSIIDADYAGESGRGKV